VTPEDKFFAVMIFWLGGERGPVTFPVFKAGDAFLSGTGGGFDFHTLPPHFNWIFDGFVKIVPFLYHSFIRLR
jgi:hypothetical protein